MELPTHMLLLYGYWLIFGWVLVDLLGLPIPVTPVLLAAGALSAGGDMNLGLSFVAGLSAALIADSTWFWVGRRYGAQVLKFLCKISLEPTTCVRKSQGSYGKRQGVIFLYSKFIPGLSALAAPIAGQRRMDYTRFLIFDTIGAILWVGSLLIGGRLFGDLLARNPHILDWVGRFSGSLLLLGILIFFLIRVIRRQRLLKALAAARLDPLELKQMLDAGEEVFIVDLRHPDERIEDAFTLPGAHLILPHEIPTRHESIPRDRDVIVFCSCPGEASAAKVALTLHKRGVERVRPLRGGYDEWKRLGFPLEAV
jgi:membrane protein DedA with SNARE-associated domain/rhodanese-related sulfurtransferase